MRTYEEELSYIEQLTATKYKIKEGFVPNMNVPGVFYVNDDLKVDISHSPYPSCPDRSLTDSL